MSSINVSLKSIESIARASAPVDTPDSPAYPNHSDTDIFVAGFVDGFKCGLSNNATAFIDDIGSFSDGHHTFNELYHYRMLYNAMLFNEWFKSGKYYVHKSWRHHDGEYCFGGGWFIVVAELPTGQVSNHYKAEHWDLFKVGIRVLPSVYDGHTPQVAAQRMFDFLNSK